MHRTTVLLTAFLFVCNVQYFASHVLTEEMLTNRCSCGVDITSEGWFGITIYKSCGVERCTQRFTESPTKWSTIGGSMVSCAFIAGKASERSVTLQRYL